MKPTKEEVIKAIDAIVISKDGAHTSEQLADVVMKLHEEKEEEKPDGFRIDYTIESGHIQITRRKIPENEFLGVLEQIKYGVLSKTLTK